MVPPLPWLSWGCCLHLLQPTCSLVPQAPGASTEEMTSSRGSGKTRSPPRHTTELAQAEELLEQQLELYQALLEGREGIQKLKEQIRRPL
uniref:Uncharacterized protein n=1 Tax=Propithecus coquereli TaxID=379532 RepID=A0A2K6FDW3_PROCO